MLVRFTKHALQRIKIRNLSKEEILNTLNQPNSVKKNSHGNLIAQKMKGKHLLRVFYFIDGNSKVVISAYKTSKVNMHI